MVEVSLPNPNLIGGIAILILAGIVIWDAFWLTKQRTDVPKIGELADLDGYEGSNEVIRQWGNLFSMAVMMALPWALWRLDIIYLGINLGCAFKPALDFFIDP